MTTHDSHEEHLSKSACFTSRFLSALRLAVCCLLFCASQAQSQTVTWTHQPNTDPDRPGWSAYTSIHHDAIGRVLFYQQRNTAGNIYSTDFFAYDTSTNDFVRIGGTGSLSSANCNDGSASNVQPWPGDRHPVQQMAVDPSRKVLWLYNGVCSGNVRRDLWRMSLNADPRLNQWTQVDISASVPNVQANGALVYSPDHDVLVLYGKHDISAFQETWVYCPSSTLTAAQAAAGCSAPGVWTRINLTTGQQPTISKSGFPQVRYHAASKTVYAFLYSLDGGASTMEVWTYAIPTRTWSNRNPAVAPREPNACCPEQLVVYLTSGPYAGKFLYHQTAHSGTVAAAKDYLYDPVANAFTVLPSVGTGPRHLAYMTWDPVVQKVVASASDGMWTATVGGSPPPRPDAPLATRNVAIDLAPQPLIACPTNLIEHHVHNHARDRHIEPDRERPARDSSVPVVTLAQSADQRDDRKRRNRRRQDDVRDQDREIDASDGALTLERTRTNVGVVDQVTDEEQR